MRVLEGSEAADDVPCVQMEGLKKGVCMFFHASIRSQPIHV